MLRKMCHFKIRDTENIELFMKRTNQFINDLQDREGLLNWDTMIRREIFKWAGWVARLDSFDQERITLHVLRHKNWEWIQTIANNNNGRQLHGRCLKIWRWESLIYNFFRENRPESRWSELAQDGEEWFRIVQSVY